MSFDSRLRHTLVVERASSSAVDDWNAAVLEWAAIATIAGLVQPKTAREVNQQNEAGAVLTTHTIYCRPADIEPGDRIRVSAGPMAGLYQVEGIRNAAGLGHHLEIDARGAMRDNQHPTPTTASLVLATFAPTVT